MRKITCITIICINMVLLSSCHIYRNYQRPDNLPTDSLFRDADNQPALAGNFPRYLVAAVHPVRPGA